MKSVVNKANLVHNFS